MDLPPGEQLPGPTGKLRTALVARLCKSAKIVAYYQKRQESFSNDVLDLPPQVVHVWAWFWRLDQARQSGPGSMQALTYDNIAQWAGLVQQEIRRWEVYAIMDVDLSYRKAMAPEPAPDSGQNKRSVSAYDASAAMKLFDSMTEPRE